MLTRLMLAGALAAAAVLRLLLARLVARLAFTCDAPLARPPLVASVAAVRLCNGRARIVAHRSMPPEARQTRAGIAAESRRIPLSNGRRATRRRAIVRLTAVTSCASPPPMRPNNKHIVMVG